MKLIIVASLAFGVALVVGCSKHNEEGHSDNDGHDHAEHEEVVVPEYSKSHGVLLPEDTRRSIGLKVVEVTEQKVSTTVPLQLRIFQSSNDKTLASGFVTPENAKSIEAGQTVEIGSASKKGLGRIKHVDDKVQKATGMVEVLVELPAREDTVLGGFVEGTVRIGGDREAVTVPRSALLESAEGRFVYAVSGDHFVRTEVKTGARAGDWIEITDGLYAGDEVASEPVMTLWMTELAAVKGGQACCITPPKGK